MKIVNCGYDNHHLPDFKINRPEGSGDYLLLIVRSPAFFVFNNKKYHTDGNSVILFKKGTPQLYGAETGEYINDWVHFEADEAFESRISELGIKFDIIINISSSLPLSDIIKKMYLEEYSGNKNSEKSSILYFNLLLLKISDLCVLPPANNNSHLYEQMTALREEILSYPQKNYSIKSLADRLSVSPSCFQHKYKAFFATNVKKDITAARIEYSKHLLFGTDNTISEIASLCGYENDVHFMRVFKKITKMTPSMYRKQAMPSKEKLSASKTKNPFCLKKSE